MRLPGAGLASLLIAACSTPQTAPRDPSAPETVAEPEARPSQPEPAPQGDYSELMIAALDAFCREEFDLSGAKADAALRLRPDDQLAKNLSCDSRLAPYWSYSPLEEARLRYRRVRADLSPPDAIDDGSR